MNINQSIRKIREYKNLTQEYVAQEVGKSRKTYAEIENGNELPKIELLEKIARTLGVTVDDIINFSNKNFLQSIFKDSASNTGVVFSLKAENSAIELKNLYEKLLLEKDLRIKALEELIIELKSCK